MVGLVLTMVSLRATVRPRTPRPLGTVPCDDRYPRAASVRLYSRLRLLPAVRPVSPDSIFPAQSHCFLRKTTVAGSYFLLSMMRSYGYVVVFVVVVKCLPLFQVLYRPWRYGYFEPCDSICLHHGSISTSPQSLQIGQKFVRPQAPDFPESPYAQVLIGKSIH